MPSEQGENLQPPIIDLAALQQQYPDPKALDIIGMCEAAVVYPIDVSDRDPFTIIEERLFGDKLERASISLSRSRPIGSGQLATSLFIDTFNRGVPASTDIDQLAWRLAVFSADAALGRRYVGNKLSIGEGRVDSFGRHTFSRVGRQAISIKQMVDFCEAQPDLIQAAIDTWVGSSLPIVGSNIAGGHTYVTLLSTDVHTIARGEQGRMSQRKLQILERFRAALQWQNKTPLQHQHPTLKNVVASLELVPIDRIPLDTLTTFQAAFLSDDPAQLELISPARLLTSSLRATQNFLTSLVVDGTQGESRIGRVVTKLEEYSGDNPLGYADITALVEAQLTSDMQRQIPDISNLDPKQLADFPKAVERLLFVALADMRENLASRGETERFGLAADYIRQLAFRGVEAKLRQRVLSVGDLVMRYASLPPRELRILIEKQQREGLSEPDLDRAARTIRLNKIHNPHKPGWGSLS